jgi:hypothetical protein
MCLEYGFGARDGKIQKWSLGDQRPGIKAFKARTEANKKEAD